MANKRDLKHQTVYIEGMHCASCELLIEKYVNSQPGVKSADASLKEKKIDIFFKKGHSINLNNLNKEFRKQGYTFSLEQNDIQPCTPAISVNNGRIIVNKKGFVNLLKVLGILIIILVIFFLTDKLQLAKYINVSNTYSLGGFFLLGIVASISTCAALVGGILLSLNKQWNEMYIGHPERHKARPHFMFHIGRLLSFGILGGVLGLIGKTFTFNNTTVTSILIIVVSLVMLVLALQMLGVKWAQKIKFTLPKALARSITQKQRNANKFAPFGIGVLTFFLPCGFTLIAQGVALTSGSFLRGGLIMFLFALGTLPILAGISMSGIKTSSKPKSSQFFNQIAGILIVFFALYNINSQLNVLGILSLSDLKTKQEQTQQDKVQDPSGIQILSITARGFEYVPTSSTTLKAGVKTKLIVNNESMEGCGIYMVGRGLFNGYLKLNPGESSITFTPSKGTYKLTCSMGMVPPVTIYVK